MSIIDKPIEREVISEKDKLKEEALRFVNSIRIKEGLDPIYELVPGRTGDPERCVITKSVKNDKDSVLVSTGTRTVSFNDHCYLAPNSVKEFIRLYDHREFPELLERNTHEYHREAN